MTSKLGAHSGRVCQTASHVQHGHMAVCNALCLWFT